VIGIKRPGSSLLFALFVANQKVRSLLAHSMSDSGMRPDEYAVYSAIFEREPITPSQLWAALGLPQATLTHYLAAMRERGHLRTARNPADGRSYLVALTIRGRTAHRRAHQSFEAAYRRFIAALEDPDATSRAVAALDAAAERALAEMLAASGERAG
jgi:DNA-binding MarR family transcriptional regulator